MPSSTMLGKLAVALFAAGQANAAVGTFGPSALETFAPISDSWTSAEPATVTSVLSVPKHQPLDGGHHAMDGAVKEDGEPALLAESGITTVTVYTATCPTPMAATSSSVPEWPHSSLATLFSTRPTTTTTTTTSPTVIHWSSSPSSSPSSPPSSSSASSSTTTSSPTPNAPGTPTVSTVSAAPPLNETATRAPPAAPTQTHHDSAGSAGMASAAIGYGYTALATVLVGLVLLPVAFGV